MGGNCLDRRCGLKMKAKVSQVMILRKDKQHLWQEFEKDKPARVLEGKIGYIVGMIRKGIAPEDSFEYYNTHSKHTMERSEFDELYPIARDKHNAFFEDRKGVVFECIDKARERGIDIGDASAINELLKSEYDITLKFAKVILFLDYYRKEHGLPSYKYEQNS